MTLQLEKLLTRLALESALCPRLLGRSAPANCMHSSIWGSDSGTKCCAHRDLKDYVYFVAGNLAPKAESAFPRLSQWLNRTLRS